MKFRIISLIFLSLVLAVAVNRLVRGPYIEPKPKLHADPPLYPGAQRISFEDRDPFMTPGVDSRELYAWRVIYFQTSDQPDKVFSFYRDTLRKEGWQYYNPDSLEGDAVLVYFFWSDTPTDKPYFRKVIVKPSSEGQFGVRVITGGYPKR